MKQISLEKKTSKLTVNQNLRLREENLHLEKEIENLLSWESVDQQKDEKMIRKGLADDSFKHYQNVFKRIYEEKEYFKRKYKEKK